MTVSRVGSFFGIDDVALTVPCKVNRTGAHLEAELLLSADEKEKVQSSGTRIKNSILSVTRDRIFGRK
jgi:Malate/lactate dehydrogenases